MRRAIHGKVKEIRGKKTTDKKLPNGTQGRCLKFPLLKPSNCWLLAKRNEIVEDSAVIFFSSASFISINKKTPLEMKKVERHDG